MPSSHYTIALAIIKIAVSYIDTQLCKCLCTLQLSLSLKTVIVYNYMLCYTAYMCWSFLYRYRMAIDNNFVTWVPLVIARHL